MPNQTNTNTNLKLKLKLKLKPKLNTNLEMNMNLTQTCLRSGIRQTLLAAALAVGLAAAASARAQDILPREEAMKLALAATLQAPTTSDTPIQVDADLKRALAGHDGEYGLLILPETKLTAAVIEAAGKSPVPVGQLWLRKLTPMVDGSPVDSGKLRLVSLRHDGESLSVPLCLLGVRKTDAGGLELVVYSKGKEPLLTAPIQKAERSQTLPIEIEVERESDSGRLTLHLGGRYAATLRVTELPE